LIDAHSGDTERDVGQKFRSGHFPARPDLCDVDEPEGRLDDNLAHVVRY